MGRQFRSTDELVATMAAFASERDALRVLRSLEADGVAVADAGGWRLSDTAERLYGRALRLMDEWCREVEEEQAA